MGKTVQFGAVIVVIVTSLLLIGLVVGAIDTEQLKSTLSKSVMVIGILVLASIGIMAIASSSSNKK
jgi:hypothetical protein